jgi:hypothetical protein
LPAFTVCEAMHLLYEFRILQKTPVYTINQPQRVNVSLDEFLNRKFF